MKLLYEIRTKNKMASQKLRHDAGKTNRIVINSPQAVRCLETNTANLNISPLSPIANLVIVTSNYMLTMDIDKQ